MSVDSDLLFRRLAFLLLLLLRGYLLRLLSIRHLFATVHVWIRVVIKR